MSDKTVLVVDDDPGARDVFSVVLRHRGLRVITAEDGAEAIRVARRKRPDLIVLDIRMPGADGWTVTEVLRHDRHTREIPIVTASIDDVPSDDVEALWAAYFQKPCDPVDLADTVERLLERQS